MRQFYILIIFGCSSVAISQDTLTFEEFNKKLASIKNDTAKVNFAVAHLKNFKHDKHDGIKFAIVAVDLAEKKGSVKSVVQAYEFAGDAYWFANNFGKASEYYFKELKWADSLGLKRNKARAYYSLGWIKCLQQHSYKDRSYLIHALKTFEALKDTGSIFETYHAVAGTYQFMSRTDKKYIDSALFYFRNLIFFAESMKRYQYNVILHANYADFLTQIGRYKEAKKYLLKCCEASLERQDTAIYAVSRNYLAELYMATDSMEKAKAIYNEILPMLEKTEQIDFLVEVYLNRSKILAKEKNYKAALEDQILGKTLSDSLNKSIFEANLTEKENAYEIDKRESSIRKLEHLNEVSELKNKQNNYVIAGLLFIALLIIIVSLSLYKSNKAKQKANQVLNEKNFLIEEQKKAVEEKNTDITNSINYAKRIQEAILPPKEIKYTLFPDAFVLFRPKDIVSGDFYWFAEKNGRRLISAIDCTGHGVPGAFMSLIGNTFLHEAVNEKGITEPALILNELRNNIISSLKQTDVIDSTKDGMDMALLSFNDADNTVEFAGANNPLWLIRNGEIIEYKGDKRPIGYFRGKGLPFTNTNIKLMKGDSLYIFTDGYADQFGGIVNEERSPLSGQGKKLKYKKLKEYLLSIQNLPMPQQETFLHEKFNAWKGNLEQVDDVCVIGIRI